MLPTRLLTRRRREYSSGSNRSLIASETAQRTLESSRCTGTRVPDAGRGFTSCPQVWYPGRRLAVKTGLRPNYNRRSRQIRRSISLFALLVILGLSIPTSANAQQASSPEERLAALINQARIAQGLNPVAMSPELATAAQAHTRDMVANGYMEHEGRDGSTPQQRAIRSGYGAPPSSAWLVIEVISARATAEAAANFLLGDAVHRRVVLRPTWREMGVAYVQGGPYGQLWTIDFGCRPNVLPVIVEPSGGGLTLRLTNEECAPDGTGDQIGRAVQVMVSDRSDFSGASWEPYAATKTVSAAGANVYVKLKDTRGREVSSAASGPGTSLAATATSGAPPVQLLAPPAPSGEQKTASAAPASGSSSGERPLFNAGSPAFFEQGTGRSGR